MHNATLSTLMTETMALSENNRYTCREYREEMLLLGLRRRLAAGDLSKAEQHAVEEQIRRLESMMDMD